MLIVLIDRRIARGATSTDDAGDAGDAGDADDAAEVKQGLRLANHIAHWLILCF